MIADDRIHNASRGENRCFNSDDNCSSGMINSCNITRSTSYVNNSNAICSNIGNEEVVMVISINDGGSNNENSTDGDFGGCDNNCESIQVLIMIG